VVPSGAGIATKRPCGLRLLARDGMARAAPA